MENLKENIREVKKEIEKLEEKRKNLEKKLQLTENEIKTSVISNFLDEIKKKKNKSRFYLKYHSKETGAMIFYNVVVPKTSFKDILENLVINGSVLQLYKRFVLIFRNETFPKFNQSYPTTSNSRLLLSYESLSMRKYEVISKEEFDKANKTYELLYELSMEFNENKAKIMKAQLNLERSKK